MALFNLLENPVANKVKLICLFAVVASTASVLNTTKPLSNDQPIFKQEPIEIQKNTVSNSNKPIFSSIESTAVRKTVFFNYLLPAIEQKNAEILKLRLPRLGFSTVTCEEHQQRAGGVGSRGHPGKGVQQRIEPLTQ